MRRNIFFTADLHLNHKSVNDFCNRGFRSMRHMNQELIRRWNSRVKENDIVYILGDFIWNTTKTEEYKQIMSELKGVKILITGNHDRVDTIARGLNLGFQAVLSEAKIRLGKRYVRLSHYPYRFSGWKALKANFMRLVRFQKKLRNLERRHVDDGMTLLFGHTHQKDKLRGNTIHVGVDSWNYYPVSAGEVVKLIEQIEK